MNDRMPITLTLRVSRNLRAELRKLEKQQKSTYSELCRTAISEYVGRMLNEKELGQ